MATSRTRKRAPTANRSKHKPVAKRTRRRSTPCQPRQAWPRRDVRPRAIIEAVSRVGMELRRLGDAFGAAPVQLRPRRQQDAILVALEQSRTVAAVVGRIRIDGTDGETMAWAEVRRTQDGAALSLFTRLGEDRARDLGAAAQSALRLNGWRTRGAGPTIGQAPGKASGIWTANLSLVALPPAKGARLIMAR